METRCMSCMRIKESSPHCEHCGFDERSQNSTHQLPVGTVVGGQYILGKVLGQGGFGITYIGWDTVLNQRVAVKEYFPSGYAGRDSASNTVTSYDSVHNHDFENNKKRFLREAESLAKLWNIPQIVKVLRHFEENGTAYIAMEYIEGDDLRRYMKKRGRPLTVQETLDILGPVMDALEHVHKAQLVHRDISPDNIMLLPDGSAKLLDFGAARYVQNADAEKDRNTSTQAILKHGFAPPEQYSSHGALGPWTDVYAMCGTIYYCLTGKIPPEAMMRSVEGAALDWSSVQGLSKQQRAALEKGLALQPGKRYASIAQLRQALCSATEPQKHKTDYHTIALTTDGSTKPASRKKPGKWIPVAAAAVIAAALGLVLVPGIRKQDPNSEQKNTTVQFVPETIETPAHVETAANLGPLEIAPNMELTSVDLGHREAIPVLSGHSPADITWISSNPQVVTISGDGIVSAVGFGTAEITAVYEQQTAYCNVSIELNPSNIYFLFNPRECLLADYNKPDELPEFEEGYTTPYELPSQLVLPKYFGDDLVVGIEGDYPDGVFGSSDWLTGVVIPDSYRSIGASTFRNCTNLIMVNIPDSVTYIGHSAFAGCTNLSSVTISRECEVEDDAFPSTCTIRYYEANDSDPDVTHPAETGSGSSGGNTDDSDSGNSSARTATVIHWNDLNIRSAPSTSAQVIGTLSPGDQVTIFRVESVGDMEWGFIGDGWILMLYVE